MKKILGFMMMVGLLAMPSHASDNRSAPNVFSSGSTISSSQMNENFNFLASEIREKEVNCNDSEKILEIIKESLSKSSEEIFSITENLSVPLREARENFEKEYLTTQIKKFGGNISKTAKFVGMERSALHRKLKLLGVKDLN